MYFYMYMRFHVAILCFRKEGKDSEYENVETDEDDDAEREQEEIRKFEEEEKRIMGKGMLFIFSIATRQCVSEANVVML